MCGRYYIDEETEREIRKLVGDVDRTLGAMAAGDVRPSQSAAVVRGDCRRLAAGQMIWGFPRFDGKGLLINARAETALEKRSFRESVRYRRCIIPARGFYEWNSRKEKYTFEYPGSPVIFMAGCYNMFDGQNRFVILTTDANPSVAPVHSRMPLVLDRTELEDWVLNDAAAEGMLHKVPGMLEARAEYEQLGFF